jgi:hypothetical protein
VRGGVYVAAETGRGKNRWFMLSAFRIAVFSS